MSVVALSGFTPILDWRIPVHLAENLCLFLGDCSLEVRLSNRLYTQNHLVYFVVFVFEPRGSGPKPLDHSFGPGLNNRPFR